MLRAIAQELADFEHEDKANSVRPPSIDDDKIDGARSNTGTLGDA